MPKDVDRYLLALPRGKGRVFLAWRLLESDPPDLAFEVERRRPGQSWERASDAPITDSTNYLDHAPERTVYQYRVVALERAGRVPSRGVSVDAGSAATIKVVDAPLVSRAAATHHLVAGELLNDGRMGFVTTCRQEGRHFLDAYAGDGRHLWRKSLGYPTTLAIGHGYGPYLAWDVNHDGRTEVVCRMAGDAWESEIAPVFHAKKRCGPTRGRAILWSPSTAKPGRWSGRCPGRAGPSRHT